MKRFLLLGAIIAAAACGGDDDGGASDAGMTNARNCAGMGCFVLPTEPLKTPTGTPDFSCSAHVVQTSSGPVTINGTLADFQTDDPISGGTVAAFYDLNFDATPKATGTSAADGAFTMTLPAPVPDRVNFKNSASEAFDTYALNIGVDISGAPVTMTRNTVSQATAQVLPGLIGIRRTDGLGILAGEAIDCAGAELENAIATVSTTSGTYTAVTGTGCANPGCAQVYYFKSGLPTGRNLQSDTNTDGLFAIMELPPGNYYLQVWGFVDAADVSQGMAGLKLLSEFQAPVKPNAVITVAMDPTEGPF